MKSSCANLAFYCHFTGLKKSFKTIGCGPFNSFSIFTRRQKLLVLKCYFFPHFYYFTFESVNKTEKKICFITQITYRVFYGVDYVLKIWLCLKIWSLSFRTPTNHYMIYALNQKKGVLGEIYEKFVCLKSFSLTKFQLFWLRFIRKANKMLLTVSSWHSIMYGYN